MGRIKSTMVKRASVQLIKEGYDFNKDFYHNKKILGNSMPSKKIRNMIAGYISRVNVYKSKPKKAKQILAESSGE